MNHVMNKLRNRMDGQLLNGCLVTFTDEMISRRLIMTIVRSNCILIFVQLM